MTQRKPIPGTDLTVFPLNLGGNTFGWTSDREESFAVLDAFVAAGGNFVDTADVYSVWAEGHSGGESEEILGAWMAERGNRDQIVLATKAGQHPEHSGQKRETVLAAIDDSLRRLQTDRVDLFYAHFDDESVTIEEQARAYHEVVESGKARHVALSNYSPDRMRQWFEFARAEGLHAPVAIQPQYNLLHRKDFEQDYAEIARHYDVAVFSYFSLASGFLTGKYRSAEDLEGAARKDFVDGYFKETGLEAGLKVIEALQSVALDHDVQITTVALAWLMAHGVTAPIASARTPEQLPALMAAADLKLIRAEVERLDEASQPFA